MRISRSIDDRLFAAFLAVCFVVGCVAQPGASKLAKPKPGAATIEALSRAANIEALQASADAIDAVADQVAAKEIKYDAALQAALGEAFNAGQNSEANKKLSAAMTAAMDPTKDTFDPVKVEKALRGVASGRRGIK